jgi:hypothetical protein
MLTRIGLIGLAAVTLVACNKPSDYDGDGFTADIDCNDNDAAIHPEATEVCDGVDNNCDNSIDGSDADGAATYYADADADGFGGVALSITQCDAPTGFVANGDDCDDNNLDIHPDAAEVCDGADNDCDGLVDDDDDSVDTAGYSTYYADADSDGYGDAATTMDACNAPSNYADNADDCDDTNADLNPDTMWYTDVDSDGFGAENYSTTGCEQPSGYVASNDDCDDLNAAINPAAQEICDGDIDNDCDGVADDADDSVDSVTFSTYYVDGDADGYGDSTQATVTQCTMPSGYADMGDDCDDAEALANPSLEEVCNDGIDNDCSGDAPECALPVAGGTSDANASVLGGGSAESFGMSDMALGDFDGDGNTDLAVSDWYGDSNTGVYDAGTVDFYYGPLSTTGIASGGRYEGSHSSDLLGTDIANAGDLDGDGADELLIGARGYDENGSYSGRAYLAAGATSVLDIDSNNIGYTDGAAAYDYMGGGVANLGDVFGNGTDTMAFAAYGSDAGEYYGGYLMYSDGTNVGTMTGDYYSQLGYRDRIAGAGDLDGDGFDDWAAGTQDGSYVGNLAVFYGGTSVSWSTLADADANIAGVSSYNYLGYTLGGGSDVDGDGYSDFVATNSDSANVYVGGATRMTDATTASISIGNSAASSIYFKSSELAMGDLNNDGEGDLVVADYYAISNAGAVWTFYGPLSAGSYDVMDADSTLSGTGTYTYFGYTNAVGDVTGDGMDDLMVGVDGDAAVYIFNGGSM